MTGVSDSVRGDILTDGIDDGDEVENDDGSNTSRVGN
jgi:hypothetical protein